MSALVDQLVAEAEFNSAEIESLRAEVERLTQERDGYKEDAERVREQRDRMVAKAQAERDALQQQVDALQQRVHLCAGYDALVTLLWRWVQAAEDGGDMQALIDDTDAALTGREAG
jgi:primosomal protein N''